MKRIISCIFIILLVLSLAGSSLACSLLWVGGEYTDDGANLFVRVEDGSLNDEVKYYLVSPAGNRKAGGNTRAALASHGPLPMTATATFPGGTTI